MKIALFVEDDYEELELWYPYYRLIEEGYDVEIVGTVAGKIYKGKYGYPALADKGADFVDSIDYQGIVIPGGYAPDRMRLNPSMIRLLQNVFNEGKMIAAICHGLWMLCSADILKGKTVTCYTAVKDDVVHSGAHYVNQPVAVDHNLVTSRTPDDLPDFCRAILVTLKEIQKI